MLHLLALRPDDHRLLSQALDLIVPGDAVVFLDQGTALIHDPDVLQRLRHCQCHVWGDIPSVRDITSIDAEGLVVLSEIHPTSLSWYPEAE